MTDVTRRRVLAGGAATGLAVAGGALLAACGTSTEKAQPAAGPTAGNAGTTAGSAGTGRASGTGQALARLSDIPVGQAVAAQLGDKPIIVARPTSDTAAAFSAICTHQGCTVAPAGAQLHCPCHGSVYNALTGAVIHGPAPKALPTVPVTVTGGTVVTA